MYKSVLWRVAECLSYILDARCIKVKEASWHTWMVRKGKAVPLQAWSGPEGSRKLRFPDFVTTVQDGGKVCQPYAPAAFTPRKYSRYSFMLEAESTPRP